MISILFCVLIKNGSSKLQDSIFGHINPDLIFGLKDLFPAGFAAVQHNIFLAQHAVQK